MRLGMSFCSKYFNQNWFLKQIINISELIQEDEIKLNSFTFFQFWARFFFAFEPKLIH